MAALGPLHSGLYRGVVFECRSNIYCVDTFGTCMEWPLNAGGVWVAINTGFTVCRIQYYLPGLYQGKNLFIHVDIILYIVHFYN